MELRLIVGGIKSDTSSAPDAPAASSYFAVVDRFNRVLGLHENLAEDDRRNVERIADFFGAGTRVFRVCEPLPADLDSGIAELQAELAEQPRLGLV